jgi:magnesium transporter
VARLDARGSQEDLCSTGIRAQIFCGAVSSLEEELLETLLSHLRRFRVRDEHGTEGTFSDLELEVGDHEYPPIRSVLATYKGACRRAKLVAVDTAARVLRVEDLRDCQEFSRTELDGALLLIRDVLDSLLIDLQHRSTTRANDLRLVGDAAALRLEQVDTSLRAVVRRLTRGLLGSPRVEDFTDWRYVEFLRGRMQPTESGYPMRLERLPAGEIAALTELIPYLHCAELVSRLPQPKAADTLEAMAPERQLQVFEELEPPTAVRLLGLMAPDIACDLAGRLHTRMMQKYLDALPPRPRERIIELLRYPEDTVGGIMTNDIVHLNCELDVGTARERLHRELVDCDFAHILYLVTEDRCLRGQLPLREVLTAPAHRCLRDLMDPYLTTLQPLQPAAQGARLVFSSQLAALPVVSDDCRLLGVVTMDAALKQLSPAIWRSSNPRIFS